MDAIKVTNLLKYKMYKKLIPSIKLYSSLNEIM